MQRLIIVTGDTLYRTLKEYLGDQVPAQTKLTNVQYNPALGKIRLQYTSKEKPEQQFADVKFNLRKQF